MDSEPDAKTITLPFRANRRRNQTAYFDACAARSGVCAYGALLTPAGREVLKGGQQQEPAQRRIGF